MDHNKKTKVYFTVDVESSMGGAWADPLLRPVPPRRRILCEIDGVDHGVGWLSREFAQRGFRATFFSEVFCAHVFGDAETREWFDLLLEAGQDVQLHTHLNFYFYARGLRGEPVSERTDNLATLAPALQDELLSEACHLYERYAGCKPLAFRAGSWVCNRSLLRSLSSKGVVVDASFNVGRQGRGSFDGEDLVLNVLQPMEGLWELPITMAHQTLPDRQLRQGLRPLDPTSMSLWELTRALESAHQAGATHVSLVFHSFSGVKARDSQYTSMRPDHVVRRRVQGLLDFLAQNTDRFEVSTVGDLARELQVAPQVPDPVSCVPELGFLRPLVRKVVQAGNRLV